MKLYKLTDSDGYTRRGELGETHWEKGFALRLPIKQAYRLCTMDVIHAYTNSNLGLLLNPIHADIECPKLWEAEGEPIVSDWGKVGCISLTIVKKLSLPHWYTTIEQRMDVGVCFGILCAESVIVYFEQYSPEDHRPRNAIEEAKKYLKFHTADAARSAVYSAAGAAYSAASAADAARSAARSAASAADAARSAARSAASAADAVRSAAPRANIDFIAFAEKAVQEVQP